MKKLLTILVLIMLIISFFQITSMYALYKERLNGDYSTLLGAWKIKVNETEVTSADGQTVNFTIADNQLGYIASEYIQAGTIAPNGKAYFDIVIDPENTDVSVVYQIEMESIDIPNVVIELLSVENYFKKDGETDVVNTNVNQDGNTYTAVMPINLISSGYKNHLRLNFKWANKNTNDEADSALGGTTSDEHEKIAIPLEINLKQYTGEVIGNESE